MTGTMKSCTERIDTMHTVQALALFLQSDTALQRHTGLAHTCAHHSKTV